MADKFDISEHIEVEALGSRIGEITDAGLVVNNLVFNQNDFNLTEQDPIAITPIGIQPIPSPFSMTVTKDSSDLITFWNIIDSEIPANTTRNYGIYGVSRDDPNSLANLDPKTDGTLLRSAEFINNSTVGGEFSVQPVGLDNSFDLTTKFWLFGLYYNNELVATTLQSNFLYAAYTYSFPNTNIGASSNGNPSWLMLNWTSNLRKIRVKNNFSARPRDATHPNGNVNISVPVAYKIYYNDVFRADLTLNNSFEYWNPDPSSLATMTPSVGTNTIKLYRANALPENGGQPVSTLTAIFGYTSNYEYEFPYPENPFRIKKHSDTSARIRWSHVSQVVLTNTSVNQSPPSYVPEGATTFLLKVHSDLGVLSKYSFNLSEVNSHTYRYERIVTGLDMNNRSYLFRLYSVNPTTSALTLYAEQTYGPNPPTNVPEEEPDVVLATGWWPLQCSVASVDITQGYDVERGLLKRPEPGTCALQMKGDEADPRVNSAIQLDAKIRVKLAAAASPDDEEDYLFAGFIENMATTYDTNGNSITTLGCVDAMSRVLNVNIPEYAYTEAQSFSRRMFNVIDDYIAPATWGVSYDQTSWQVFEAFDRSVFPPEERENVSASEIINELTEGEYAIMIQNRGGVINWYSRGVVATILAGAEDLTEEAPSYGFSTQHDPTSLDHFCISDFTIENSMDDITNKVVASISYDELTTITYVDQDSIDRYGERSYDVQLNLYTPAEDTELYLQRWVEEVPYFESQSELRSVTTNVVNRHGYVTRAYQHDANLDPIRVFIQTGPVNVNGVFLARSVRHSITPEGWTMDLTLTAD